jgi:hypothetical protein
MWKTDHKKNSIIKFHQNSEVNIGQDVLKARYGTRSKYFKDHRIKKILHRRFHRKIFYLNGPIGADASFNPGIDLRRLPKCFRFDNGGSSFSPNSCKLLRLSPPILLTHAQ